MFRALKSVTTIFKRRPLLANAITYSALYAAGDVSQQTITRKPTYDWKNTGRISAVGFGIFGPGYVLWYRFLDGFLPGKTAKIVVKKIFMDQFVAGTIGIALFFTALGILEGKKNPFEETIEKGPKTFALGLLYWPAAQSVNFFLLPTHLRSVYVACAAFVWLNIVCYIKSCNNQQPQ